MCIRDRDTTKPSRGATGAQGPKGDTGPQGLKGDTGARGATGATGGTGAQGPQGVQGLKGDTGAAGAKGATGAQGVAGPQGAAGAKGADGLTTKITMNGTTYTQSGGIITLPQVATSTIVKELRVVDAIPAVASQEAGVLYLKFES